MLEQHFEEDMDCTPAEEEDSLEAGIHFVEEVELGAVEGNKELLLGTGLLQ